jgi:hypothetical protein
MGAGRPAAFAVECSGMPLIAEHYREPLSESKGAVLLKQLNTWSLRCDASVNQQDPHEPLIGSREPATFHFGVGILGDEKALDEFGVAGRGGAVDAY